MAAILITVERILITSFTAYYFPKLGKMHTFDFLSYFYTRFGNKMEANQRIIMYLKWTKSFNKTTCSTGLMREVVSTTIFTNNVSVLGGSRLLFGRPMEGAMSENRTFQ